jgi:hypothetical protein
MLYFYYPENLLGAADSLLQALEVLNLPEEGNPLPHFHRSILKFRHRLNGTKNLRAYSHQCCGSELLTMGPDTSFQVMLDPNADPGVRVRLDPTLKNR